MADPERPAAEVFVRILVWNPNARAFPPELRDLAKARFMEPFARLTIVQFSRLKSGLILVPLLAFVLSYLPILSAATRHNVAQSSAKKNTGKAKSGRTAISKSSGNSPSKAPARGSAKGSAGSRSTKSAGSAKGSKKGASRAASKRSKPAVYRQMQPESGRVREIQQALNDRGYPLEVNGAWDASTVDALRKFQTDQKIENLSGKGKLDSMTLIALGLGPKREPPSGTAETPKQTPEGK